MNTKAPSALVITSDETHQERITEGLKEQKFRIIFANNPTEARLKFANEKFSVVLFDSEFVGLKGVEFIESIRHKEKIKNIKQMTPVLVLGDKPEDFTRDFCAIDHVKYQQTPFEADDLKKNVLSLTTKSDAITNNTQKVKANNYLIEEGSNSHEMFWVLSGKFVVTKVKEDSQRVIIGEVLPGELVGEMSFLDNLPRSASVRALEDSEVLVIPHTKFIDVLEGQPRWFRSLMQTLSQRLRNTNKIIATSDVEVESDS